MVSQPTCPICEKSLPATAVTDSQFFPFCSERCRNVDLLRWTQGNYAIVDPMTPEQVLEELEDGADMEGYE